MSYEVGSGGPVTDEEWEAHNALYLAGFRRMGGAKQASPGPKKASVAGIMSYEEWEARNAPYVGAAGLSAAVPEAKSKQVGGDHYSKLAHQPWDILQERLGPEGFKAYLLGTAVAYLIREKNGLEDLQKARHTLDRLIELETDGRR